MYNGVINCSAVKRMQMQLCCRSENTMAKTKIKITKVLGKLWNSITIL